MTQDRPKDGAALLDRALADLAQEKPPDHQRGILLQLRAKAAAKLRKPSAGSSQ